MVVGAVYSVKPIVSKHVQACLSLFLIGQEWDLPVAMTEAAKVARVMRTAEARILIIRRVELKY